MKLTGKTPQWLGDLALALNPGIRIMVSFYYWAKRAIKKQMQRKGRKGRKNSRPKSVGP